jgi:hypothetical protein
MMSVVVREDGGVARLCLAWLKRLGWGAVFRDGRRVACVSPSSASDFAEKTTTGGSKLDNLVRGCKCAQLMALAIEGTNQLETIS